MVYIFMDESGDLGFKKGSSKWFLFSLIVVEDIRKIEKLIRKIRKSLKKKYKKEYSELHAYHCDDLTRIRVLRELNLLDISIVTVVLDKSKVNSDFKNQKNHLYNYTANILIDNLINSNLIGLNQIIYIIVDKKDTNKNIQRDFISYITKSIQNHNYKNFKISLFASHNEKGLQAVDFISWAIFRKYERGEHSFYDIIKDKIISEKPLSI